MLYAGQRAPRLEANAITDAGGDYDGLLDLIGEGLSCGRGRGGLARCLPSQPLPARRS